jgi:hypothetical protein
MQVDLSIDNRFASLTASSEKQASWFYRDLQLQLIAEKIACIYHLLNLGQ